MLSKYLSLLRPSHYLKNVYLFLPIFFSGQLFNIHDLQSAVIAFISFCFVASSIYILNDIRDIPFDKLHPVKRLRHIPAGLVSLSVCYVICTLLFIASVVIAFILSVKFLLIILTYFILNVCYSWGLKNIAIVDVAIVSIGFVLRVVAGGIASHIFVSRWLVIMVFLLSMFQALTKRMDDLYLIDGNSNQPTRKSLSGYNIDFLQITVSMLSGVLLVCYIMYIVQPEIINRLGEYSYGTTFFVLLGLLRYLQLTFVRRASSSPVKILINDRFIQLSIISWVLAFAILIYIK
ncbi:MAG: hypothetical protein JWR05_1008 [Mucilaginibacter sp.]|nr:hypothetical protein [Mucilaginibacter sp.]